jgi:hypothetical protein
MDLAIQAEQLPKLRDKLLDMVNQINMVLNEGRNRKAPRAQAGTADLTTRGTPRKRRAGKRKGHPAGQPQPKPLILEAVPQNAQELQGISTKFVWSQGMGMISLCGKQPRLLRLPDSTKCYGLKDRKGNRSFLGMVKLEQLLGYKPEMSA